MMMMNKLKYQIGEIEKSLQKLHKQLSSCNLSEDHLQLTSRNLETLTALADFKLRQFLTAKYIKQ